MYRNPLQFNNLRVRVKVKLKQNIESSISLPKIFTFENDKTDKKNDLIARQVGICNNSKQIPNGVFSTAICHLFPVFTIL